jgi:hypothetical protein
MKMVKVYDSETHQLSEMPAAELAPHMVKITVLNVGTEEAYVDVRTIKNGPLVRVGLTEEELARLRKVYDALLEEHKIEFETMLGNLCREIGPDNEIEFWEHLAKTCIAYINGKAFSLKKKREVPVWKNR